MRGEFSRLIHSSTNLKFKIDMAPLPDYRPKQLSVGPLEAEILQIIWELGSATVKDVHDRILSDPNRELAYTSVTTVLRRLTDKGWLACDKKGRAFYWRPLLTKQQAEMIKAHEQLQRFLAVGNPDVIAAFADSLDEASSNQIEAIAKRIQAARQAREGK
ncbi:putative CopY family transcriptional regulator [Tolypothrix sp. PCC 7601]|nr:putative CopY family transcriptional regulator [Tolypothrix sp. PCC 7601]